MKNRDVIFYDDACGMCRRSSAWLIRLDWLDRLERRDMLGVEAGTLPVTLEDAMNGMPMLTREGPVLLGFPAVRRALRQTPLGFLPGVALHLPLISHLGQRVYQRVAVARRRDRCFVDPK